MHSTQSAEHQSIQPNASSAEHKGGRLVGQHLGRPSGAHDPAQSQCIVFREQSRDGALVCATQVACGTDQAKNVRKTCCNTQILASCLLKKHISKNQRHSAVMRTAHGV